MEHIPLVTTLKFPRFSCKRLKIKKIHRYFVSAIVTAHQTKKLMLCHIDRVFRRCCGNYCWVVIALCCGVRFVQCLACDHALSLYLKPKKQRSKKNIKIKNNAWSQVIQCQDLVTRISNFHALTVSRRFHGPIFRTVLARSLNIF